MGNRLSNIYMTFVWLVVAITGIFHFVTRYQSTSHEIAYNHKKSTALYQPQLKAMNKGRGPASVDGPLASCDPIDRGLNMTIGANQISYLRNSINVDVLTIEGQLHCDQLRAASVIEIKAKSIIVKGTFQCGTQANPYTKKLIISLKDSGVDPRTYHAHRGIIVEPGGKLILNGDRSKAGWYKLAQTVMPGDQSLFVDFNNLTEVNAARDPASGLRSLDPGPGQSIPQPFIWKSGDKIVLGPTGFNYLEAEHFTIVAVNPITHEIYLDHPAQFQHWGETQSIQSRVMGTFTLDERAEVANLTRSILIRADESEGLISEGTTPAAQIGGHMMVHDQGQAYIDSVELYKMGQAGVMARYPFHWHWVGDATGQYIKNSSIHHSFQRCVTVHRTQNALVQNNVCYDFKGHGYFLEDGNETGNKIIHNLAIKAKAPSTIKLLLASDNVNTSEAQGRFPSVSAFWISNPKNVVRYNVASGSVGTGIWMSFENEVKDPAGNIIARPINENTTDFSYNSAHSSKLGITWYGAPTGGLTNNPNNPNDRAVQSAHYAPTILPTFRGLKAYKNNLTGIYLRGNTAIFKNTITADNGWSFWVSYNSVIKDSIFIGSTQNSSASDKEYYYNVSLDNGRKRKAGIVIYDGPFEIHHSDFLDFSTAEETYVLQQGSVSGTEVEATTVPIITTGGTNKFTNLVSDIHFNPSPIHRIHTQSKSEEPRAIQSLGNAVVRDLDGTFSGRRSGRVITGYRSLAITPESNCEDGGEVFYNFKLCPSEYKEGSLTFMRWGGNASPWGTPFIVRRSDGIYSYTKDEWSQFPYHPNNLFATASGFNYTYELLPYYDYKTDKQYGTKAHMDANHENFAPVSPIVKIVAYGTNCKLEEGAIQVPNIASLKRATSTAYYTNGSDFYVRIIPRSPWDTITGGLNSLATAYTTMPVRHGISCDNASLAPLVLGSITSVSRDQQNTTIKGWACSLRKNVTTKVKLYAYGKNIYNPADSNNTHLFIKQVMANQESHPDLALKCGVLSKNGRNFSFSIPNVDLARFNNHRIYVEGIAVSGGTNQYLENSGRYPVVPLIIHSPPKQISSPQN